MTARDARESPDEAAPAPEPDGESLPSPVWCPALGLADDRSTVASFPTLAHRCFALGQPLQPTTLRQSRYCLRSSYTGCEIWQAAATGAEGPKQGRVRRWRRPLRLLAGLGVIVLVLALFFGVRTSSALSQRWDSLTARFRTRPSHVQRLSPATAIAEPAAVANATAVVGVAEAAALTQPAATSATARATPLAPSATTIVPATREAAGAASTPVGSGAVIAQPEWSLAPSASSTTPAAATAAATATASQPASTEPAASPSAVTSAVATSARTPAPPTRPTPQTYVVQPGDSLSALALRFGVTVPVLAAANGLPPTAQLLIGERLIIPVQLNGPATGR